MTAHLLTPYAPRIWGVIPEPGENVVSGLRWFAMDEELGTATVTGIGSFDEMVVAGPPTASGQRPRMQVDEPVDLVSMTGTLATDSSGRVGFHAMVVACRDDHTVVAGKLLEGVAGQVLELVVRDEPAPLFRRIDDRTGLPLLVGPQVPRHLRVADPQDGGGVPEGSGLRRSGHTGVRRHR